MQIIAHLEKFIGKVLRGWNSFSTGENWPLQIIEMDSVEYPDIAIFSTLGMSNFTLVSSINGTRFSQELITCVPKNFGTKNLPSVLFDVANYGVMNNEAFLRGSVFDCFEGYIFPEKKFTCFYLAPPIIFDDTFANQYFDDINKSVFFGWLVPIYENEKVFINNYGWTEFEKLLEEINPNLFDLDRNSIVE